MNPVLADVDLATLTDREITIWRSGRVQIGGVVYGPAELECATLTTAGGGLVVADPTTGLGDPQPPPTGDHWVGLDFDTIGAAHPVRVREIVLDGHLAANVTCGADDGNVELWDVTTPGAPVLVPGGSLVLATSLRNHRSYFPVDLLLDLDRHYRLVAHADLVRETPIAGPIAHGDLTVQGGLSFPGAGACPSAEVDAAVADPSRLWLTVRFAPIVGIEHYCVATANSSGLPGVIDAVGAPSILANDFAITAHDLPPNQFAQVFYGATETQLPFGDGFRCVTGHLYRLSRPTQTSAAGDLFKPADFTTAPLLVSGSTWRFQLVFHDPGGAGAGFNTTDAIRVTFCP